MDGITVFLDFICKCVLQCGTIVSADPSALIRAAITPLLLCLLEREEEKFVVIYQIMKRSYCFFQWLSQAFLSVECKTTGFLLMKSNKEFRFRSVRSHWPNLKLLKTRPPSRSLKDDPSYTNPLTQNNFKLLYRLMDVSRMSDLPSSRTQIHFYTTKEKKEKGFIQLHTNTRTHTFVILSSWGLSYA